MHKTIKFFWFSIFILCLLFILIANCFCLDSVRIVPLDGPMGVAQISPANGSATPYLMSFRGQKSICFQSAQNVEVYIGTHSAITNADGWGMFSKGESLCADLKGGTTLYFYGNGASADVRAFIAR